MNILLVDDHTLVRAGIAHLIERLEGRLVIGQAATNHEALRLTDQLRPDLVMCDISMGADSGLDLIEPIASLGGRTRVMVLTMHADEHMAAEALRLGAAGYLLKDAAPSELEIALRAVENNDIYLSPAVSRMMVQRFVRPAMPVIDNAVGMLTGRQQQILTMIASRRSTKEIAYELDLSVKTIAAHRAQIMERTGVRDVVGLALFAVRHGLVDDPSGLTDETR